MTALNHMTDEDLKAMGMPMVCVELVLEFLYFSCFSVSNGMFCSSIDNATHVHACYLECVLYSAFFMEFLCSKLTLFMCQCAIFTAL